MIGQGDGTGGGERHLGDMAKGESAAAGGKGNPALRVMVVVPIHNEETHVGSLLEKLRGIVEGGAVEQVVFVDDGSTDQTGEVLRRAAQVRVVRHPRRCGCGASIRSGYRQAMAQGVEVVVVMAGNGKDDPREIPKLLEPILRGRADYVQGSRFLQGGASKGLPWHRFVAMRLLTWLMRLFLWRWLTDCTNGFRAYRTTLLRDARLDWEQAWLGNDYELELYMHYKAATLGYRLVEVPVAKVYQRAKDGSYSKARLGDWFTGLRPVFYLRLGLRK